MKKNWLYQVRIRVDTELSDSLRANQLTGTSGIIFSLASQYGLRPVCTYDAFRGYCLEAEANKLEDFPLYEWTKNTIENPEKIEKHKKSFAFYKENKQIYEEDLAKSFYEKLKPLLEENKIQELNLIDSNPANNPQPPTKQ